MAKKLTFVERVWNRQPDTKTNLRINGAIISARDNAVIQGRNVFRPPYASTTNLISGALGKAYKSTTTGSNSKYKITPITLGTGDFTLCFFYRVTTPLAAAYHYLFGTNFEYFTFAPRSASVANNAALRVGAAIVDLGVNLSAVGIYKVVIRRIGTTLQTNVNNQIYTVTNSTSVSTINEIALNTYVTVADNYGTPEAEIYLAGLTPKAWNDCEVKAFIDNPWSIFEPEEIPLFKPEGTGPVTHPTSGNVVGNTATVTGSALRSRQVLRRTPPQAMWLAIQQP